MTIARHYKLRPRSTDLYILACIIATTGFAAAAIVSQSSLIIRFAVLLFVTWRFFELLSINVFEFCVGAYRPENEKGPVNRVVILKLLNLAEMFILFAIVYYLPGKSGLSWMNKQSMSFFESFYFSVVTATTLGYGDYYPIHWVLKLVTITEVLFFVLIGLSLLAIIRQRGPLFSGDPEKRD